MVRREATRLLPHDVNVVYEPAFPRGDGSTFSWLQIVFAVGPGNDDDVKHETLGLFGELFRVLIDRRANDIAEMVSLRARRRIPDSSSEHPPMYIEVGCDGAQLPVMDPEDWYPKCFTYVNRFDRKDPLMKIQKRD